MLLGCEFLLLGVIAGLVCYVVVASKVAAALEKKIWPFNDCVVGTMIWFESVISVFEVASLFYLSPASFCIFRRCSSKVFVFQQLFSSETCWLIMCFGDWCIRLALDSPARTDQVIIASNWPWCFTTRTNPKIVVSDWPWILQRESIQYWDRCIRLALVFFGENWSNSCSSFRPALKFYLIILYLCCVLQAVPAWGRVLEYVFLVHFFICLYLPSWIHMMYMLQFEGEC